MKCPKCGAFNHHTAMTDGMEEDYYWCWNCNITFDAIGEGDWSKPGGRPVVKKA